MKQTLKLLLGLSLILLINSCQKDYPKDIPDWLEDKIKEIKKEHKGEECWPGVCRRIDEYAKDGVTTFWYMPGVTPVGYQVFDYDGTYQCSYDPDIWFAPDTICGNLGNIETYSFVRRIWEEKQ